MASRMPMEANTPRNGKPHVHSSLPMPPAVPVSGAYISTVAKIGQYGGFQSETGVSR